MIKIKNSDDEDKRKIYKFERALELWKWKSLNGMINENTDNGNEKGRPKE